MKAAHIFEFTRSKQIDYVLARRGSSCLQHLWVHSICYNNHNYWLTSTLIGGIIFKLKCGPTHFITWISRMSSWDSFSFNTRLITWVLGRFGNCYIFLNTGIETEPSVSMPSSILYLEIGWLKPCRSWDKPRRTSMDDCRWQWVPGACG